MSKYHVYPVYGKDKPSCLCGVRQQIILGFPKEIENIKDFRKSVVYGYADTQTDCVLIIDWKRYKLKKIFQRREYPWQSFRIDEFYKNFRFTDPCEDWEIESKGYVVDAVAV